MRTDGTNHLAVTLEALMAQLRALEPDQLSTVKEFVEFISARQKSESRSDTSAYSALSQNSFAKVWDNDEDSIYDSL